MLELLGGIAPYLPEVEAPKARKVPIQDKMFWTAVTLLIYLVASQVPLYGIRPSGDADPLAYFRALLASNRGSLMELGISPIVNAGLIMQLLTGLKVLDVNHNDPRQRQLFEAAQKVGGIVMTIATASMYVFTGMYGSVADLGYGNAILIITQLFVAGILVLLLDELLNKYGMGSGISLFIATNICEGIVWSALSPRTIETGTGAQYQGAIVNLFAMLLTRSDKIVALKEAFYRPFLPNITNLMATILVFGVVVYFQGFRVDLPVKYARMRKGLGGSIHYPIKMFYTSNMPIIIQSAMLSNLMMISRGLWSSFRGNILISMLGHWAPSGGGRLLPVGGIAYYLSPPRGLGEFISDPLHVLVYIAFMLASCSFLSAVWLEVSGSSPRDVAKRFKDQGLVIQGHREQDSIRVLNRYIPIAAAFGGMAIGGLTVFADFLGAVGSGTGLLLAVNIIFQMYEQTMKEMQAEAGPGAILKSLW